MTFKKAHDTVGLNPETQKSLDEMSPKDAAYVQGTAGGANTESTPPYLKADTDKVLDNREKLQNSAIVFGRDRPRSLLSGYGGRGDTQSSTIDIVAGYQGPNAIAVDANGKRNGIEPDLFKDAARIYISQKTDVDLNFALAPGTLGSPGLESGDTVPKSAIAMKADGIRIIAREGIKLVTGTDSKNSQGGKILGMGGVDIIAGNEVNSLQPLVKGDNLVDALNRIVHHINKLSGIVDAFCTHQMYLNSVVADHYHISPFQAQPTLLSMPVSFAGKSCNLDLHSQVLKSIELFKTNLSNFQISYLEQPGEKYINSRFNNSN